MRLLPKLGVCLSLTLMVAIGVSAQDCDNMETGFTLPCNQDLDPWKQKREKADSLTSDIDQVTERRISTWKRIKYGREKVKSIMETPDKLSKAAKATAEAFKKKTEAAAKAAQKTAEEVADTAKKATGWLQKGAKILGKLAAMAQFVGPIMDIVLLFAPLGKSEELKAIESGFAEMGAKIDAISFKLESIEGALDWNSVVSQLMEFEGNVKHITEKYKQLVEEINAADPTQELSLTIKGHIEDLVNAIRTSGEIGNKLQLVENLFKGTSAFTKGKTLLEMFVDAVDNDCSKILPMSNKLIAIVKDAQRLQYFYEINQKLVEPDDDKGYPRAVYEMYTDSIEAYKKCTNAAVENAEKEMQVLHGDGESLIDIIDKMEPKYDLYNWMTIKENDKEDEHYALIDNFARKTTVELTGLSDDEKEKQSLTLLAVKKSSVAQVDDAIARIERVLVRLEKSDLPQIGFQESWDGSGIVRHDIIHKVRNYFQRDDVLKSLIQNERMSMAMFEEDSSIELTGWHFKTNMEVLKIISTRYYGTTEKYLDFTIAFSFNFKDEELKCPKGFGKAINLSFDGSFPYCLCNFGYGGDSCEVSLSDSPKSSNSVMDMVQLYKVPGMFDLQNDVREGTEKILRQMENNKQEIFSVARQTSKDLKKTENAILSAQSIMMNQLRADNAKVLNGLSGLQTAMEAAFEKNRNDMIFRTEEGQKVVIQTISEGNKRVLDGIEKLSGKVIENRYFQDLKLNIPVFQQKFETAIEIGSPIAEQMFSEYLDSHEQKFRSAKKAAKKAMVEKSDSFIAARMQIAMVSGCTDGYNSEIKSTWADLMEVHLAMTTIQMWDLDYKIRTSDTDAHREYYEALKSDLESDTVTDTNEIKAAYNTRSCPGFSMSDLVGGGCAASVTYPGQTVPMSCSDPNKSLILTSTSQVISEISCNQNGWDVNVEELMCVTKCIDANKYYNIGEKKELPQPPSGYLIVDEDGNAVSESTCLALQSGWTQVKHDVINNFDLENYPLEIRTDSVVGSNKEVKVEFSSANNALAGVFILHLTSTPQYRLFLCTKYPSDFPTALPTETDKIWRITLTRKSEVRLMVHCNKKEVLNVALSDATCPHETWSKYWSREVKKIRFPSGNGRASGYYRPGPGGFQAVWSVTKRVDIDECATPDFCRFGGTCANTPGSYTCTCVDGHILGEDGRCEDVNECSHGNVGYQKCLVQQQLGTCRNTPGGYTCGCLAGSYTTASQGGKECLACNCNSNGVTSAVCDGKTGACLCNTNVGGEDCSQCTTGYTNFPYCNQCAVGYYGYPSCAKCSCSDNGVTAKYCDPYSGTCECKPNVGGTKCDRCKPNYADNCVKTGSNGADYRGNIAVTVSGRRCQNWESQSPNGHGRTPTKYRNSALTANYCRNPDGEDGAWCYNAEGTSPRWEYCSIPACPETGVLNCVKDVRDGTWLPWGSWGPWKAQDVCGPGDRRGFDRERKKTRECDDTTKNVHGTSCKSDERKDDGEYVEREYVSVCKKVDRVFIRLHNSGLSGTDAQLWMGIRQGNIECTTVRPTWDDPDKKSSWYVVYWVKAEGCGKTFDETKPVQVYLYSSNGNAVYIREMGVEINGETKKWISPSGYTEIDYEENNGWWTTTR